MRYEWHGVMWTEYHRAARDEQARGIVDVLGFVRVELPAGQDFARHGSLRSIIAQNRNLDLTRGLVFSGALLLELVQAGLERDDGYRLVQAASREAWEKGRGLRDVAAATGAIREHLSAAALARAFDLQHHLRHVDAIFERTLREAEK